MKKAFLLAAIAALTACSSEQLSSTVDDYASTAQDGALKFSARTPRTITRAGVAGDITNNGNDNTNNIGEVGFGVFGYYTPGTMYGPTATPNFMYNQKVTKDGDNWMYEPAKYWPNEFGSEAASTDKDRLSFFAYAPHVDVEPTTGLPFEGDLDKNITALSTNTATGDPLVKYVVDTDPQSSVDLLWGVAPATLDGIGVAFTDFDGKTIRQGEPFINLVKPSDPEKEIMFNLCHALAKVKFTIDAQLADDEAEINADETRIYVRWIKINGIALKGALNLNNGYRPEYPNWLSYAGDEPLKFTDVIINDGRKDGKEATSWGADGNEKNVLLNSNIIQNDGSFDTDPWGYDDTSWSDECSKGVTIEAQPLFASAEATDGYFYVIPRNGGEPVNITICYDVETIDRKLGGFLADNVTHGKSVENIITVNNIFADEDNNPVDFEAGKMYNVRLHLGMADMKFETSVYHWNSASYLYVDTDVPTPDN